MSIRDVGLLLLGAGIFILALVVSHFYITKVLPGTTSGTVLVSYCEEEDNHYIIRVRNVGTAEIRNLTVYVSDKNRCFYPVLGPGSNRVCLVEGNGSPVVYEIQGIYGNRPVEESDVCRKTLVPRQLD